MARAASHRQEQAGAYQKGLDMGEPKESKLGTRNEYTKITALHVADQQPMLSPPVCAKAPLQAVDEDGCPLALFTYLHGAPDQVAHEEEAWDAAEKLWQQPVWTCG